MDFRWKNWDSLWTKWEDSAPPFAFNNVAFERKFTGSQLEYVSTVNSPFIQETKIYIIFKSGEKSFFKYLIHNCLFGAVKLVRNTNARNAWSHNDGTLARNVVIFGVNNLASHFTEDGSNDFFIIENDPA